MNQRTNDYGQPIGEDVPDWTGAERPTREGIAGRLCRLEAIDADKHLHDLYDAFVVNGNDALWTYMPAGPFRSRDEVRYWLDSLEPSEDPLFYAIVDTSTEKAVGIASFLRIDPAMGVIEVGYIAFSPLLQRTVMATEAMYLMMSRVFDDWGYRRYEWKCDALNAPSRRAAARLGFSYEGTFLQATIYKRRNRDTAWFSILDKEWPAVRNGLREWLAAENFDTEGHQLRRLQYCLSNAGHEARHIHESAKQ